MPSFLNRLLAESKSGIVFHKPNVACDIEKAYRQFKRIFVECDYMHHRHGVSITMALLKTEESISSLDIKKLIRLTDRHVEIDETHHTILFTFTNVDNAYRAILRIEKNLYAQFATQNVFDFACVIAEKQKGETLYTLFKKVAIALFEIEKEIVIIDPCNKKNISFKYYSHPTLVF